MTSILWRRLDVPGAERCVLDRTAQGVHLIGTTLVVADGAPYEIRWSVQTDAAWRTRTVGAHVQGGASDRRMALHSDGEGVWTAGESPVLGLFGAVDVDLAWTPATNTLPIGRLGLDVGESREVTVAYIDFPGHAIERRSQRYERRDTNIWRFSAGDLTTDLTVGDDQLVRDYPGLWVAESTSVRGVS